MKLFVRGLSAFGLFLAVLIFAGCNSTSAGLDDTPVAGKVPAVADAAHFHIGETVNVAFSGPPEPIDPHEEIIKEDGTITLPLIGAVKAVGETAGDLQTEIHNLYVPEYYVRLTVTVKPGDRVYYVRGEVKQPGRQLYLGETTVTKAITSAGDFTDFASHKVSLVRANGGIVTVDVDDALQNSALDLPVYPGDQITVPRRIF